MIEKDEAKGLSEAVMAAQILADADEEKRVEVLHRLRQSHRLSETVRAFNQLLADPQLRPLGEKALRQVGLGYSG